MRVQYDSAYEAWKDLKARPVDGIPPAPFGDTFTARDMIELLCGQCGYSFRADGYADCPCDLEQEPTGREDGCPTGPASAAPPPVVQLWSSVPDEAGDAIGAEAYASGNAAPGWTTDPDGLAAGWIFLPAIPSVHSAAALHS